jgi:hypothetical protein
MSSRKLSSKANHVEHDITRSAHSRAGLTLLKLTTGQADNIAACFKLYDHQCKGFIDKDSAKKLTQTLGFNVPSNRWSSSVSLSELLLLVDQVAPDTDPPLECALEAWSQLVGHKTQRLDGGDVKVLSVQDITDFFVSVGQPPPPASEATALLTAMLDYDDCSDSPQVPMSTFVRYLSLFARKNNILKDIGAGSTNELDHR